MNRRAFLESLSIGIGAGLCGIRCAGRTPAPVDFSEATHYYESKDYDMVRRRWTRHGILVRDIGTVIEFWATYKSWDFRQAYLELYAETYGLGRAERQALRQAQLEAFHANYEFHLVAQSTNYKWNDLEQRDSVWKVALVDGAGRELVPASLSVEKLPELYEMRFFPDKTDFTRTYALRFPRGGNEGERAFSGPESGRITLRASGPLGRAEVAWESA